MLFAWGMENSKGKKRGGLKKKREKKKKKKRKEWKNDGGWEVKVCPPRIPFTLALIHPEFLYIFYLLVQSHDFKKESFSVIETSALSQILHMIIFPILLLLLLVSW